MELFVGCIGPEKPRVISFLLNDLCGVLANAPVGGHRYLNAKLHVF